MPYNTRRKSLSLPSLGIHVPVTHAARAAAAAAAAAKPATAAAPTTAASRGASPASASPSSLSSSSSSHPRHSHSHSASLLSSSPRSPAASMPAPSASSSPKRHAPHDAAAATAAAHAHHSPQQHPSKRTKRVHHASDTPSTPSRARHAAAAAAVSTPPQSPIPVRQESVEMDALEEVDEADEADEVDEVDVDGGAEAAEIDMDAVNDDIVEAVIHQLQATGNRPHLIKELSAVLMQQLKSVQQSANPCAIISSRLASYMKRPCWSASAACPLTKELETIHPRRTYYFLTTCPHLPLPDASSAYFVVPRTSIVTPPLSSAASGSEAATEEEERRRELSPSPEVDLSSPEFDDLDDDVPMPGTPIGGHGASFPASRYSRYSRYARASGPAAGHYSSRHHHRGASPPLEKDEKEFTQTAEGLQKQKLAGHTFLLASSAAAATALASPPSSGSGAHGHDMDLDDAGLLFGPELRHLNGTGTGTNTNTSVSASVSASFTVMTSPAMRPAFALGPKRETESDSWAKLDTLLDWDRSPENIELDELDGLLDEF